MACVYSAFFVKKFFAQAISSASQPKPRLLDTPRAWSASSVGSPFGNQHQYSAPPAQ